MSGDEEREGFGDGGMEGLGDGGGVASSKGGGESGGFSNLKAGSGGEGVRLFVSLGLYTKMTTLGCLTIIKNKK